MTYSIGGAVIHCYAPTLIIWTSTECLQSLKSLTARMLPGFVYDLPQSGNSHAIVMSDRDRARVLAVQANEWRKQQLNDVQRQEIV